MKNNQKKKEDPDFPILSKNLEIGNFADLSITEIITLQILLQHLEPIVRHTLYLEVNQYIQHKKKFVLSKIDNNFSKTDQLLFESLKKPTDLSTSSFYNSLSTLEKKGLLAFKRNKKGKIETISATSLTKSVINVINQYFLLSIINDTKFDIIFPKKVITENNQIHYENLLIVWLHDYVAPYSLNYFNEFADEIYLLANRSIYDDLLKVGLKKIKYSSMYKKIIREPDNIFNAVIIPRYCENPDFFNLSRIGLLKEIVRVTRPEGEIILITRNEVPIVQNFLINQLITLYNKSLFNMGKVFTRQNLQNDMNSAGLTKIEIFEDNGRTIGIGRVP
ncbi:MAG: hypothetical protein ACFFCE_01215 [Promethearchaeota archaeon]